MEQSLRLLAERDKNAAMSGLPRDRFLKKKLYSTFRRFTPKAVQKMDNDWWMISGCATFERHYGRWLGGIYSRRGLVFLGHLEFAALY
jgi:hypothetical protein